jgi:uncharacterized FlaG/YvyC family protein
MSINPVGNGPKILDLRKVEKKTHDASADRENMPNGGDGGHQHHKMNDEEIQKAIERLRSLQGIKDNNLIIKLDKSSGVPIVFIEDYTGKVVRRIPESELWQLSQQVEKSKGHLIDRTG